MIKMQVKPSRAVDQYRLVIVAGRFNAMITQPLVQDAFHYLAEQGVLKDHIQTYWVPGAIEIPLIAQKIARSGNIDAIIAIGAVIQGETDHYDYVCQQASYGCQRVILDEGVPVIFGVLTTQTLQQAQERTNGVCSHTGREAAKAALEMIALCDHLAVAY